MGIVLGCRNGSSVEVIHSRTDRRMEDWKEPGFEDNSVDMKIQEQDVGCSREDGGDKSQKNSDEGNNGLQIRSELDVKDKDGDARLHKMASRGCDREIRRLLKAGANVDVLNLARQTPLYIAISKSRTSSAKILLTEGGANWSVGDLYGRAPIHAAAETGNLEMVEELVKVGANVDVQDGLYWTPLHVAASEGQAEVTGILLKAGANPNLQDNSHFTPLQCAASVGHLEVVKVLAQGGVRYDMKTGYGETVLHMAVRDKHEDIVDHLLENFHDSSFVNTVDIMGHTALHIASQKGLKRCVCSLIRNGSDVNIKDSAGLTALHCAVEANNTDIVKALLERNCNINSQCRRGRSPLHIAIENTDKNVDVIKCLLVSGAISDLPDSFENRPIIEAINCTILNEKQDLSIIRVFLNHVHFDRDSKLSTEILSKCIELSNKTEEKTMLQISHLLILGDLLRMEDLDCFSKNTVVAKIKEFSYPLSLKCMTRISIRRIVKECYVTKLPVPAIMRDFIAFVTL